MIHIGFRRGSGEEILVPLVHTITAAQTRYGKSTLQRHMIESLPDNFKVLCLDVKDPRDYEGAGTEIPIYIENRTDPLMLKQLLEQQSHLWLRKEFPELIDLCKKGDTYERVLERVNVRMSEKVHPVVRDRLKVLKLLLEDLVSNLGKMPLSDKLTLPSKVNVMNLAKVQGQPVPSEVKQLAVYSSVKEVLRHLQKVVLLIDELPDFAPQGFRTPSKSIIIEAIRKGGAKEVWLWLSGQTMTGVDKQVLKQAMIWILGHQREINEAKRTLDQIPFKTGLKVEDIMTLPVGQFVVCTDVGADITYVQPSWLDMETARKVAVGELSLEEVSKLKEGEDLTYKPLWEKEKDKREELEREFEQRIDQERHKIAVHAEEAVDKRLQEIAETYVPKAQLKEAEDKLKVLEKDAEFGRRLRELFTEYMPKPTIPESAAPSVTLAEIDERINQRIGSGPEPIPVVSVNVDQRIKELVKNDVVNRLVTKIRSLPEPAKKAAWWLHEKRQANVRALYNYIYDRPSEETGRIPGSFYMNVINPLQDAWLIINEGGNIRWALQEKLAAELKDVFSNSDLEKTPKYLASLLL